MKLNGTTGTLLVVLIIGILAALGQLFPEKAPAPEGTAVAAAEATQPAGEGFKMPAVDLNTEGISWGVILWGVVGAITAIGIYMFIMHSGRVITHKESMKGVAVEGGELNGVTGFFEMRRIFGLSGTLRAGVYTEQEALTIFINAYKAELIERVANGGVNLQNAKAQIPLLMKGIKPSDLSTPDDLNFKLITVRPGDVDYKDEQEEILTQRSRGAAEGNSMAGAVKAYMDTNPGITREEAEEAVQKMTWARRGLFRVTLPGTGNSED
jgi:hypothetical protein